jgi:hypothetical protein
MQTNMNETKKIHLFNYKRIINFFAYTKFFVEKINVGKNLKDEKFVV